MWGGVEVVTLFASWMMTFESPQNVFLTYGTIGSSAQLETQ